MSIVAKICLCVVSKKKNDNIKAYNNIDNWGYYPINLDIAPFNLAPYKTQSLYEKSQKRYMFLYCLK